MYLVVLAFLLVFIVYFLYQEEINYYIDYSKAKAHETASSAGGISLLNYYKYHMI